MNEDTKYKLSLHIFRRDLRLADNTALQHALNASSFVLPCFIFDKRQIEKNEYKSEPGLQFMLESLQDLASSLQKNKGKLYFFYGVAEDIVKQLIDDNPIEAVFVNRDYTPFSIKRDQAIKSVCQSARVDFHCYGDALLHEPEEIAKKNGKPYTIFTPYYRLAGEREVRLPQKLRAGQFYMKPVTLEDTTLLIKLSSKKNPNAAIKGGRTEAVKILRHLDRFDHYQQSRDYPAQDGTTYLSSHNKFGTLSIREIYRDIQNKLGPHHLLIKELYWRDFFTHIAYHFPIVFQQAFHERFNTIRWKNNERDFRAWCEGRTGFPIVDAGMRELNITGFMHNRVRMIVASFLTKDLHIDWRWGEKYFAQQLIDYDPSVNNGNWQWAASTGCDAQPFFRIFNPWLQQEKYDSESLYIKQYIPELAKFTPKVINHWYKFADQAMTTYPKPLVDHSQQSAKAKVLYRNAK
ncbi:MAG: deoxyribodipyrimidine photo-lyase [Gammaproteobacteria bacterium]|nr:deoxyribodipyrimidine photo-lyase [Gammaproteobacteria bacterium]